MGHCTFIGLTSRNFTGTCSKKGWEQSPHVAGRWKREVITMKYAYSLFCKKGLISKKKENKSKQINKKTITFSRALSRIVRKRHFLHSGTLSLYCWHDTIMGIEEVFKLLQEHRAVSCSRFRVKETTQLHCTEAYRKNGSADCSGGIETNSTGIGDSRNRNKTINLYYYFALLLENILS